MKYLYFLLTFFVLYGDSFALFSNRSEEQVFVASVLEKISVNTPPANITDNAVYTYADLYQIIEVDEKMGWVMFKMWVYVFYHLQRVEWDESEYDGTFIQLSNNSVWHPDLVMYDASEVKYEGYRQQAINKFGMVISYSSVITFRSTCNFDITYFPFDTQVCEPSFGQWLGFNESYNIELVPPAMLNGSSPDRMNLQYYIPNDQWELLESPSVEKYTRVFLDGSEFDALRYTIKIRRISDFYVRVLIVPTVALLLVSCLTFTLPVECGEKVSLSITLLLAQIVTLLGLQDILPPSGTNFPILGEYVMFSIILTAFSVVATVMVINIHNIDASYRDLPPFIFKRMSCKLVKLLGLSPLVNDTPERESEPEPAAKVEKNQVEPEKTREPNAKKRWQNAYEAVQITNKLAAMEQRWIEEKEQEAKKYQWQKLAAVVDRLVFILYTLTAIGGTVLFVYEMNK